ncbi:Response regulator mcs4 [Wickerhamomyces ciferrii]|uniref:Response regulator mcs4 n=1 Tax=Wickerhamomyces ciferrii (strain ATCC 14091 / BCRC 22168 / CBS 111 / JCM 3599 / NBRC 0793 / NRRL Y-1031 F-60-10) TaxID=1206466 RepID=K0KJ52_WICCF|nr:Response regulator mcs4 [Wickerhamomyces ciferrii]CCH41514.1 Response regulator mcs4 [Wickerhamomyces ciferrii]
MSNKQSVKYSSPTKNQQSYRAGSPQIPTINTSRETLTRRIWIRRHEGNPTSLYVKETDLVDDLKSMIMQKFPHTIAKACDPADLVIKLEPSIMNSPNFLLSPTNQKFFPAPTSSGGNSSSGGFSPSFNSPISPIPVSATKHSSLISQKPLNDFSNLSIKSNSPAFTYLEADKSIWTILDQYYPNGMTMENAFIIEIPNHLLDAENNNHDFRAGSSRRGASHGTITEEKEDEDLAFLQSSRRMNSLPTSHSPFSLRATPTSYHRRSQSNPADHSSAVLLLPKDFSQMNETLRRQHNESASSRPESVRSLDRTISPSTSEQTLTNNLNQQLQNHQNQQLHHPLPHQPVALPPNSQIQMNHSAAAAPIGFQRAESANSMKKKDENSTMAKVLPSVNVLIVEDNLINLRILSAHLRRHKIHYDIAKNGQEAIDKWRTGGFHLVLMDIQLPVMSGLGASKEIRRLEKINRIGVFANSDLQNLEPKRPEDQLDLNVFRSPVIIVALTASTMKQDKQEALAAGCNDYLTKPVNLDWLLNKITEWGCMQALIDFDGWKSGERMTNISAAIPNLTRKRSSSRRIHSHEVPTFN